MEMRSPTVQCLCVVIFLSSYLTENISHNVLQPPPSQNRFEKENCVPNIEKPRLISCKCMDPFGLVMRLMFAYRSFIEFCFNLQLQKISGQNWASSLPHPRLDPHFLQTRKFKPAIRKPATFSMHVPLLD